MYEIYKLNHSNKEFMIEHMFVDKTFDNTDEFIDNPNCIGYYAANGTDVLGYVYGYILPRFDSLPMLYIHSIDVNEEYRHKGVGTLMMDTILNYAKEQGLVKVFLITNKSNQKAVGLYTKTGGNTPYDDDIVFEWR